MQEVCGEKSSQKTQIHKKIVNLHQNPKTRPEKVYPYSENSPRKVCEFGRNSPRKVLIHSITAYWLGDYNVGRNGPILTLPFYMAFLLREV